MPVKLSSTGGGSVTLTTPSTATDYTATFPANTGNVVTDSATQTLTNKTLTTPTIATINSGSSTSLTLQSNGTNGVIIDTSQNLQFNSGYGSVATAYGCRAWVNFNGTGTVAIRASGNVTSITDNGTGDYTVNFTNAMPDANYSVVAMGKAATASYGQSWSTNVSQAADPTSSAVRLVNSFQDDNSNTVTYVDSSWMFCTIIR